MTYKVIRMPQTFYEDKKSLSSDQAIEAKIQEMANAGYEYVGSLTTSSEIHEGCCCCKRMYNRYDNQLIFKK